MPESLPSSPGDVADDGRQPTAPWRPPMPTTVADRVAAVLERAPAGPGKLVAGALVAVAVAVISLWLLRPPPPPIERTLPRAKSSEASPPAPGSGRDTGEPPTTTSPGAEVIVHAAGAVQRPGVYRLRGGARVDDLVAAAGGLGAGADVNRLNLAAALADGERIYVPHVGEVAVPDPVGQSGPVTGSGRPAAAAGSEGGGGGGPIDLNTATAEELDTLPGVGPATAQAILDYRGQHGRFRSVDELLEVRGIGDAKLAGLRSKVQV